MYTRKEIPFNIVSLSFSDAEWETAFRADYFEKNIRALRLYLLLGFLLYGLFGIHDYWIIPEILPQAWGIRYLLVCPLLLGIYLFSFTKKFFRLMQPALFLACFAAGAGIIVMSIKAAPPGNQLYYSGLLLCLLFYFRLRFVAASLLSWSLFFLYEAAALLTLQTPSAVLFSNTFIFLSFIITGMFASHVMERYYRSDFLLRQAIQQKEIEIQASKRALEQETLEHRQETTEKHRLEAQLSQAQKMEAVGQLANGIAHEFTNIITAVIGYANYLQMKMEKSNPLYEYAGNIITSANRASRLTNNLLAFCRKKHYEPRIINLNEIILKAEDYLHMLAGRKIRVAIMAYDKQLIALADEVLLEQVLVTLVANARDAMPNGGVLTISIDLFDTKRELPLSTGTAQPGRYGRISVTDMGIGMNEQPRALILEPYFSTKAPEKGTGPGLSLVYDVIGKHNGFVDFSSQVGSGTTCRLLIPLIQEETVSSQ